MLTATPLGAASAIVGADFDVVGTIAPTEPGSISGTKWNDENGNQIRDASEHGLPGWTIYLDENNNGQLDRITSPDQTITLTSANIPQTIPDENLAGVKSTIDVTEQGIIEDVNVTLDITHSYDADVHATLVSPTGKRVKLFANVGINGDNFHNTVLDDSASTPISTGHAPFTGTFRPQEPLSAFVGENAIGQWKLELFDDSIRDVGVLNSWSLTLKMRGVTNFFEPFQVTDANGDYTFNALQPGPYNVREFISPAQVLVGWQQTSAPAPFTLQSGSNVQNVDFGNWIPIHQTGSIQGRKYYDANQNGVHDNQEPGLPDWIVYIDSNNNGVRDIPSPPTVIASTDVPKAITNSNTTTSLINVASLGTVLNIEVTLDITHSYVGDLDAFLVSPSGRIVELFTGVGGEYNDFHNLTLSDNASRNIASIGVNDLPYSGTWRPEGRLSEFTGEDAEGIWKLVVTDTTSSDEGTLNSWSLRVTSGELFRTTDADGIYQFENVTPGNYIIREEAKPGWAQVPPADTSIPAAIWNNSQWNVTVVAIDDPTDPDGPDSHRNVRNVDFGNFNVVNAAGDFNRDIVTNASDFVLWHKTLGSHVTSFSGADGDGNGTVEQTDLAVWRTNYGKTAIGSGSGSGFATVAAESGAPAQSTEASEPIIVIATRNSTTSSAVEVSVPAPAATAPEPLSTEQALLVTQVASEVIVVTASDSVTSPAASMQVFELLSPNSAIECDVRVIERPSESASRTNLGLLAWLAGSTVGERLQSDSLTDDDLAACHLNEESHSTDAAFELLEGNALELLAI